MVTSGKQQVLYSYGKAETGKTKLALHTCKHCRVGIEFKLEQALVKQHQISVDQLSMQC